ncbi:MAG: hypothetical protein J0J05_06715 [Microbacterium sp.]|uniref:hypothetical protein n=1 Tax=Microbacterium sp. TaxID=51671 RepID=UPI001AD29466|nr:hypothetical protein [Microbacterium sp.]MBN9153656.1 hypothetical protein [Microbacterium sp.]
MGERFDVRHPLLRGPSAYVWFWVFGYLFFPVLPLAGIGYLTVGSVPRLVSVIGSIILAIMGFLWAPSWLMLFSQRRREKRAGYTTMWSGEDERGLDEVDPSTGLIIRAAGDDPLTKPERRAARTEARAQARRLVASGAPYELPFGWIKPRPR